MTDPRTARMRAWLESVCAELEVAPEVLDPTTGPLLDLIRQVAHGPSRPGAPLTAFLIGLAAGTQATADADELAAAVLARVTAVEALLAGDAAPS